MGGARGTTLTYNQVATHHVYGFGKKLATLQGRKRWRMAEEIIFC